MRTRSGKAGVYVLFLLVGLLLGGIGGTEFVKRYRNQGDTADKCSALSLAKVGWVLGQWLKTVPGPKN